ncbi:MAG TPA: glycerol acyltransferase, partial [Anaeromyxobacter sp.]
MGGTRRRKKAGARARPRRPALGNDPFERGAAEREPVKPGAAPDRAAAAAPAATALAARGAARKPRAPGSTATSTPTPTPTPT